MAITKIVIQQINTIDSTNINVGKYPRYVVRLGNSISSITAAELSTAVIAAQGSANAASASATAAKTSETNSKTSETNAKASETAANTSKNAAAASATAAKTSETNSKTSETNSAASAADALASQNAAKTSETNSKTSETKAKTSETNAKASETAANTSKNAAAASATAALASQNAAKTSETNSKTSETNSAASAAAAAQSAADAGATVGNVVPIIAGQLSDANTAITTGIYTCNGSTTNIPVAQGGILEVYKRQGANNVVQEFSVVAASSASVAAKRWVRTYDSATWTTWQEVFITKSNPPDFGAMGAVPTVLTDFNTAITIGVYSTGASTTNGPAGIASGGILEVYTHLSAGNYTQIFHTTTAVAALANRHFVRMFNGTTWSAWAEIYTTANKPTAADVLAVATKGNIGDTTSINTLGTGNNGLWAKGTTTGATVANGFPEEGAVGYLEVIQGGNYGGTQKYTVRNGNVYVRSLTAAWNGTNGPWGPWIRVAATWSVDVPLNTLTTENLNTLGGAINSDKTAIYYQTANARATTVNNYPEGFAGTLFVTPSAYGYQQRYESFRGNVYYRALTSYWNGVDGPWSEWTGLPMYGYGLDSMPNQTAFDFQQFSWVSGGRYYTPGANITNIPAGISLAAGTGVTVIVEQLTASGTRATLTVIPDTAADSNFRVYKVLSVGAKGSRVFNVRQELSSVDTTLNLSTNDNTLVPVSGGLGLVLKLPALRVSGGAGTTGSTMAIQGYTSSTADLGSNIVGTRSGGAEGVHGALAANRSVLTIQGAASDGTQYRQLGRIDFWNMEATTATSWSGEIRFATTPTGTTSSPVTAMVIDNLQNVTMTKGLTVAGVTNFNGIVNFNKHDSACTFTSADSTYPAVSINYSGAGNFGFWDSTNSQWKLRRDQGTVWHLDGGLSLEYADTTLSNITLASGSADVYLRNVFSGKTLQLRNDGVLSYSNQPIYHTGNKPTAADVGALSLTGGTLTGGVTVPSLTVSGILTATNTINAATINVATGLTVGATRTTSGGIEIGSLTTAVSSYIDFHSSGTGNDFDARIAISGGAAATGGGTLVITAAATTLASNVGIQGPLTVTNIAKITGAIEVNGIATFTNDVNVSSTLTGLNNVVSSKSYANELDRVGGTFSSRIMVSGVERAQFGHYVVTTGANRVGIHALSSDAGANGSKTWTYSIDGSLSGQGPYNNTSDIRIKTDITTVKGALAAVCSWRGATYTKKDAGRKEVGLFAQDIEKDCPEAIYITKGEFNDGTVIEDLKGVNLSGVTAAYHTEAIKELVGIIEKLEARIQSLESK